MDGLMYRFWLEDDIVAIEDLNGIESVTANMDVVLRSIEQQAGSLVGKYVIYADSLGIWDAIISDGENLVIYPLGGYDYKDARAILAERLARYGALTCPIKPIVKPGTPYTEL